MPWHDDIGRERDALGLDLIVFLIEKSLLTVVASGDGVIQGSSNVNAWRTRHDHVFLRLSFLSVKPDTKLN